ncbi:MAG TPA: hypothetical protein VMT69_16110 [Kineosporiaceae bacterium]|nr:hypothetical protein [Kineosporiaceae bacterium]
MAKGHAKGHSGNHTRTTEARLLAMADRLFTEYQELPVRTVFQAIGAARMELRERSGGVASPEDIEALARRRLTATGLGC